jgi:hypothetical protein
MPSRDELLVVRLVRCHGPDKLGRSGSSSLPVKADKAGLVPALLTPSLECRSPRLIGESDVNRHIFDRANRHRTQRFLHRLHTLLNGVRRARPEVLSIQNLMTGKEVVGLVV